MSESILRTKPLFLTSLFLAVCLHLSLAHIVLGTQTTGAGTPLTLDDAIKLGLANSPKIAAVQCQVKASMARVSQARSVFFPRVDVTESFNRTTNPMWAFGTKLNQEVITTEDFDPARLNDPDGINNFGTSVSVTLPVYDQGKSWIGFTQARLDEKATLLSAKRARQEVIADVIRAYLGVLLAGKNLRVVEKTLETARAHDKMVRSRYESGVVVKSDMLRAEVRMAELEQERLHAQSQVEVAKATLNAAMGAEIDEAFRLTTPLVGEAESPHSLEEWITKALENRPDLQQTRFRETMARQEVKKAKAAHLPGFYLSGSYDVNSEDFSDSGDNYTLAAVMHLNLFSGLGLEAKVHEAAANLREVQAMVRQLELGIRVETRQAFFMAQSAHQRIEVAEAAVDQAEEGLRIVRNRYESGLFTIVNLLDAEVALQQARTNYFRSVHDFKVAMAQLKLGAGIIDNGV